MISFQDLPFDGKEGSEAKQSNTQSSSGFFSHFFVNFRQFLLFFAFAHIFTSIYFAGVFLLSQMFSFDEVLHQSPPIIEPGIYYFRFYFCYSLLKGLFLAKPKKTELLFLSIDIYCRSFGAVGLQSIIWPLSKETFMQR